MAAPALAVLLEGRVVGLLERTRAGALRFSYDRSVPATSTPLSLSLPVVERSFSGRRVARFVEALLPESDAARAAIGRRHPGVDPRDPLSLLAAIGTDCPGAVQFCLPDAVDRVLARPGSLTPVTADEIEAHLGELRLDDRASWAMTGDHWSLGGTQAKFALRHAQGGWCEPQGSEPSSHIVKPGIRSLPHQALVEHVTMRAAQACGVDVARTEYVDFGSERAIVVRRFDRRLNDGRLERLHQEDLCQALGAEEKYEAFGGPGVSAVIQLLRDTARTGLDARASVSRFLDGVVFNTVVAGPDAHARNYAVLLRQDRVHLAPVFDVATSLAYARKDRVLSMSVGGEYAVDRVGASQWTSLADSAGLDPADVLGRVERVAAAVLPAISTALDEVDDWDGSVRAARERLLPALRQRLGRLEELLAAPR